MEDKKEMKDLKLHGEDLPQFGVFSDPQLDLSVAMKDEEEIWFETISQHHHHHHQQQQHADNDDDEYKDMNNEMLDVDVDVVVSDPSSLFYADFPPLPDFPCMSSSSSSSSTPASTIKPFGASSTTSSSSASSGASSWAGGLRSDADQDPDPDPSSSADMVPPPPSDDHHHHHQQQQQQQSVAEVDEMVLDDVDNYCMDMMQNFGCIDLLESADICWDPSPLFEDNGDGEFLQPSEVLQNHLNEEIDEDDNMVFEQFMQQNQLLVGSESDNTNTNTSGVVVDVGENGGGGAQQLESGSPEEDLAMVFFEWLKSNKEAISAEDLRNIKIKKSTIDNAAKRLGGGKEGMKQLLKLILQWVQHHHLQNKQQRTTMASGGVEDELLQGVTVSNNNNPSYSIQPEHNNNNGSNDNNNSNIIPANPSDNTNGGGGNPNCVSAEQQQCFSPATWGPPPPPQPFVSDQSLMIPTSVVGYMGGGGDLYSGSNQMAAYPPPPIPPSDYHSWGPNPMHFGVGPQYGPSYPDAAYGGYGNPPATYPGPGSYYYHPGPGEGFVRLGSSATKEARKKRMARQRRFFAHHNRSSHSNHHNHNGGGGAGVISQQMMINQMAEQQAVVGNNNNNNNNNANSGVAPHGNWVYWPPPPPPPPPMVGQMMPPQQPPMERPGNGFQKQVGIEKKQGWKTEKNLRFLLQKVLKQSDVGNLGRIVLPKKEAETHLPELEARDGIPIAMEDIGTSRVWNMRYRFWPNNKSRMYLLENTGDFVRSNGLQEGDFIVIYSDVKCGKYMIRGVKVRAQQGTKPETTNKKPNKTQKTEATSSPAGSPTIMQSSLCN